MFLNNSRRLKKSLDENRVCLGLFHVSASSLISESLSCLTLDWLVYDMEASPTDRMGLIHFLQSLKSSDVTPVVRPSSVDHAHLEQVLDAGVPAIIIPKVHTKELCQQVVSSCKYRPLGTRGVNPIRASNFFLRIKDYFANANDEILVFVQIESKLAVENIDEILQVKGLDGVFIGSGDLSMDLGCPGEMHSPVLLDAIDKVRDSCRKFKKVPGVFAYNNELAAKFINDGFKFVAVGNDLAMLQRAVIQNLETLRSM